MGTGTGTGVENRGRPHDGNGDGSGDRNESNLRDENGDEDGNEDGNEGEIEEGGGEVKKRKKPRKNCRRDQALLSRTSHHVGKRGVELAGTRQLRSQRTKGLSKNCKSKDSVSPLARLIRGFRNKSIIDPPLRGSMQVA